MCTISVDFNSMVYWRDISDEYYGDQWILGTPNARVDNFAAGGTKYSRTRLNGYENAEISGVSYTIDGQRTVCTLPNSVNANLSYALVQVVTSAQYVTTISYYSTLAESTVEVTLICSDANPGTTSSSSTTSGSSGSLSLEDSLILCNIDMGAIMTIHTRQASYTCDNIVNDLGGLSTSVITGVITSIYLEYEEGTAAYVYSGSDISLMHKALKYKDNDSQSLQIDYFDCATNTRRTLVFASYEF
jgi:hypothetical protein